MQKLAIAASLAVACSAPVFAAGPAPATAPASAYSTAGTDIGTLVDNPETKAVLDKHMPGFTNNPQIEMARAMTLKHIQPFVGDQMTDAVLARIDADLATIKPAK